MKIIITEEQSKKLFGKEKTDKEKTFTTFSEKRYNGAKKISDNAKEKGGPAMLTYHHFVVKLPYYKKAMNNKLNLDESKEELSRLLSELNNLSYDVDMDQTYFQRLVGKIEVLGELIIQSKK